MTLVPSSPIMMPGPPRITLDQESFKALASEVRVGVLKKLDERRQTVTDLSNLLGLSKPTLLEHLEKLQTAGLVKRVDEGRKWIYYELSDKGRKILHPERVAIVLALASTISLAAIGVFFLLAETVASNLMRAPAATGGNQSMYGPAVPLDQQLALAGVGWGWVILLSLSLAAASAVIAFLLHHRGKRRQEEFFSKLVAS